MRFTLHTTLGVLALPLLAALSPLALADTPDTVGRIAELHGQVSIVPAGEAPAAASLNWPVSAGDRLSTVRGAGAEFRVGAAAVRLDGDSELEISQLDDDGFKLRLLRGAAAVRIADADLLDGFELSANDARVVLLQPGWVRVDLDRQPGVVSVGVLAGSAQVDGPGASLQVLAGRRAELSNGDLLTGSLERDSFDNWPEPRLAAAPALRYVSPEVTGYEELDRYGNWSESTEYGPLWVPSAVPVGWAPYQDGRWIWRDTWGWTWIDAAPWGYAPSHYGSWVQVGTRWGWAPGRGRPRPVWAPALVGWHGHYPDRPRAGVGGPRGPVPPVRWFPLTPRDRYVPGFRATPDYARRVEAYRTGHAEPGRPARPPGAGPLRTFEPNRGQPGRPLQGNAPGTNFGQVGNQREPVRTPLPNAPGTNFGQAANQRDAQRDNEQRQQRENLQRENLQRENMQRENMQRDNAQRERERAGQQRQWQADPGRQLRGREAERRSLQTEAPGAPAVMPQPVMSRQPARQETERERPAARPPQAPPQPQPQPQLQQRPQPQPQPQPQQQAQRPPPQPPAQPQQQAQQQAQQRPPAQQAQQPHQEHREQRAEPRGRGDNPRAAER